MVGGGPESEEFQGFNSLDEAYFVGAIPPHFDL